MYYQFYVIVLLVFCILLFAGYTDCVGHVGPIVWIMSTVKYDHSYGIL